MVVAQILPKLKELDFVLIHYHISLPDRVELINTGLSKLRRQESLMEPLLKDLPGEIYNADLELLPLSIPLYGSVAPQLHNCTMFLPIGCIRVHGKATLEVQQPSFFTEATSLTIIQWQFGLLKRLHDIQLDGIFNITVPTTSWYPRSPGGVWECSHSCSSSLCSE